MKTMFFAIGFAAAALFLVSPVQASPDPIPTIRADRVMVDRLNTVRDREAPRPPQYKVRQICPPNSCPGPL